MKPIATDIPDDPAALPGWLERHLVGLDLAALVAELEAVHGPAPSPGGPAALDALLGGRLGAVLDRGLSALPDATLRQLLRRPRALLDLQKQALLSGGDHWRRLADASEALRAPFERGRRRLPAITGQSAPQAREGRRRRPLRWAIGLAAAASVLAGAFLLSRGDRSEVAGGWGWDRPGALPQDVPASAYLNRLADAAEDWFRQRPADASALAGRIAQFRRGCDALIRAEHRPLSPADREWLVTKCRAWAAKLDADLAALRAGEPALDVRDRADRTIRQLIDALRERANVV